MQNVHFLVVILSVALAMSEGLAQIPSIAANSNYQLFKQVVKSIRDFLTAKENA